MFVKKYALQTIKKGFIISDGCRAKKPKFIHLCEPFVEPPMNRTKKRKHRQQKYPKNEKNSQFYNENEEKRKNQE